MPRRYVAEMVMDRIAASKVYLKDNYTDDAALHAAAAKLEQAGGTVLFAQAESYPCASSDIRSGKIPPEKWPEVLPPEVLAVIRKNKLYGAM